MHTYMYVPIPILILVRRHQNSVKRISLGISETS